MLQSLKLQDGKMKGKKAVIYLMEIMFCILAFSLLLLYFSDEFQYKKESDESKSGILSSVIATRDIDSENLQNAKIAFERVLGSGFGSEMFITNSTGCFFVNETSHDESNSCYLEIVTSRKVFKDRAILETGELVEAYYWSRT